MDDHLQAAADHHTEAAFLGLTPVAVLALIFKYGPDAVHFIRDVVGHLRQTLPQRAALQPHQS